MLGDRVAGDWRAVIHEFRRPLARVLQQEADVAYEQFVVQWRSALALAAETRSDELAQLPRLKGQVEFIAISETTRSVSYTFHSDPPPANGRFALLHAELPPLDTEVSASELRHEDLDYARSAHGELAATYPRGTRFYSTFAVWAEQLGCEIITGWTRREMQ
jgi:hypothetical protein